MSRERCPGNPPSFREGSSQPCRGQSCRTTPWVLSGRATFGSTGQLQPAFRALSDPGGGGTPGLALSPCLRPIGCP